MTLSVRSTLGCAILGFTVALLFPQSSAAQGATSTPTSVETRRQQLLSLFDEDWQFTLRTNPEWATMLGDSRYNDRLSNTTPPNFSNPISNKSASFWPASKPSIPQGFHDQTPSAAN